MGQNVRDGVVGGVDFSSATFAIVDVGGGVGVSTTIERARIGEERSIVDGFEGEFDRGGGRGDVFGSGDIVGQEITLVTEQSKAGRTSIDTNINDLVEGQRLAVLSAVAVLEDGDGEAILLRAPTSHKGTKSLFTNRTLAAKGSILKRVKVGLATAIRGTKGNLQGITGQNIALNRTRRRNAKRRQQGRKHGQQSNSSRHSCSAIPERAKHEEKGG